MNRARLTRSTAVGLALAALAASPVAAQQDLRSADARDAAQAAEARQDQPAQDLRSADARDAAEGRGTFNAPEVTVVKVTEASQPASGGLDWGDAGIGAGGLLGLMLLGFGGALAVAHRRQRGHSRGQTATTG
jgi:hypothetical protein